MGLGDLDFTASAGNLSLSNLKVNWGHGDLRVLDVDGSLLGGNDGLNDNDLRLGGTDVSLLNVEADVADVDLGLGDGGDGSSDGNVSLLNIESSLANLDFGLGHVNLRLADPDLSLIDVELGGSDINGGLGDVCSNRADLDLRLNDVNISGSDSDFRGLGGNLNSGNSSHEFVINWDLSNGLELSVGLKFREIKDLSVNSAGATEATNPVVSSTSSAVSASRGKAPVPSGSAPVSSATAISGSGVLSPASMFSPNPGTSFPASVGVTELSPEIAISSCFLNGMSQTGDGGGSSLITILHNLKGEGHRGEQGECAKQCEFVHPS